MANQLIPVCTEFKNNGNCKTYEYIEFSELSEQYNQETGFNLELIKTLDQQSQFILGSALLLAFAAGFTSGNQR